MLIFAAFTALGMTASAHLKKRQKMLEAVLSFIRFMKIDFEYSPIPLERMVEKYALQESYVKAGFISDCREKMQKNEDFPLAWRSAVESESLLSKEEKAKLISLGSVLGTSDSTGQISMLCIYEEYFVNYLKKADELCGRYCKTAVYIGVFAGFGMCILLI